MELQICNLTKQYGKKTAVDQMNLTLTSGIYGLLGENGAGKTTLMRLLCGIQTPSSGRILLNGKDACSMGEGYRRLLGYLPQQFGCYGDFSALDFLLYLAALKGVAKKHAEKQAEELLELVGLADKRKSKIRTFSGGMKQRLGIAQALLGNPRILILDEPTAGLDPRERIRFRSLIGACSRDRIILLSTHIISDVECLAEKLILMKAGKVLQFGKMEEITAGMDGMIWECIVPSERAEEYASGYRFGSVRNAGNDRTVVRVFSKRMPSVGAVQVKPDLEDLYLYYFGGGDRT